MLAAQQGASPLLATVQAWYSSLPLCTKVVFTAITGIFLAQLVSGFDNGHKLCISAESVVFQYQVYRVVSSVLVHGGLLHVTFNMLAFVPMANSLERLVGTLQFTYLLLLFTVLAGLMYVVAAFALALSRLLPGAAAQCAIGFSGVIFGLVVVDNAQSGAAQRSIFGLFAVPAQLYPWALLVFWQLLMPGVSFVAHLAGVVVGQLWVWGHLRALALPRGLTARLEESWLLAPLIRLSSFIMMPGSVLPYTTYDTTGRAGGGGSAGGGGGRSGGFGARLMSLGKLLKSSGSGAGGGGSGSGQGGGGDGPVSPGQSHDDDSEAAAGGGGAAGGAGRGPFQGTGRVLGGGGGGGQVAAAPPPGTAAALAAEARMKGAAAAGSRAAAAAGDKALRS